MLNYEGDSVRKWLLNFIEIAIFIVITLTCMLLIVQSTLLKNKSILGYRSYVIGSNSMYPVLEYGDVIIIKEVDYDKIKIGDIVTYYGEVGEFKDKNITHEVVDIIYEDDIKYLKTKGRANSSIDPKIREDQIFGKYVYRFILLSFMSKIVRDEFGFILFIFIPFGILFVLEFINMVKETKRRELEKIVRNQLNDLKKINNHSKEVMEIENTVCVQLEQIMDAKRDFKKMNELECTIRLSIDDIDDEIRKLKSNKKRNINANVKCLEDTVELFSGDDIKKEIMKELKLKNKMSKKKRK